MSERLSWWGALPLFTLVNKATPGEIDGVGEREGDAISLFLFALLPSLAAFLLPVAADTDEV